MVYATRAIYFVKNRRILGYMKWWASRRVHSSWLISVASFGVLIGALAAHYINPIWFSGLAWLLLGITLLLVGLKFNYRFMVTILLLSGGLIGLWRGSGDQLQRAQYQPLVGQSVQVSGKLKADLDVDQRGNLRLQLADPVINQQQLQGIIWVSTDGNGPIERGDIVSLTGQLDEGFGSFAAAIYRADVVRVQRPIPGDVAGRWRDKFADNVRQSVDEPQASLGLGYLVGQRRFLEPELDEALRIAGLTHVVVASGFHLSTIVRFVRRWLEKLSRFLATAVTSFVTLGFLAVTGLSPSMSRAALVTGFSLAAWYYGRKFHPLVLLPFVAALTVLVSPSYIWGSLGWQLSFSAFAGVMILAPLLQRYFFGPKKPGTVRQLLGETISAQLATWPILAVGFGQISTLAIFSNLLILPFVPLAMLLTLLAGVSQIVLPLLAGVFGLATNYLIGYMVAVVEYIAGLPFAIQPVEVSIWWAVLAYLAMIGTCVYMWRQTNFSLRDTNIVD